MQIQLPCDHRSSELEFWCENPSLRNLTHSPERYINSPTLGITAYLIRVLDLRHQIRSFVYRKRANFVSGVSDISRDNDPLFTVYRDDLTACDNQLPPDMQDSERAVYLRSNAPESDVYIMVV
jgi:hypothetical protein